MLSNYLNEICSSDDEENFITHVYPYIYYIVYIFHMYFAGQEIGPAGFRLAIVAFLIIPMKCTRLISRTQTDHIRQDVALNAYKSPAHIHTHPA